MSSVGDFHISGYNQVVQVGDEILMLGTSRDGWAGIVSFDTKTERFSIVYRGSRDESPQRIFHAGGRTLVTLEEKGLFELSQRPTKLTPIEYNDGASRNALTVGDDILLRAESVWRLDRGSLRAVRFNSLPKQFGIVGAGTRAVIYTYDHTAAWIFPREGITPIPIRGWSWPGVDRNQIEVIPAGERIFVSVTVSGGSSLYLLERDSTTLEPISGFSASRVKLAYGFPDGGALIAIDGRPWVVAANLTRSPVLGEQDPQEIVGVIPLKAGILVKSERKVWFLRQHELILKEVEEAGLYRGKLIHSDSRGFVLSDSAVIARADYDTLVMRRKYVDEIGNLHDYDIIDTGDMIFLYSPRGRPELFRFRYMPGDGTWTADCEAKLQFLSANIAPAIADLHIKMRAPGWIDPMNAEGEAVVRRKDGKGEAQTYPLKGTLVTGIRFPESGEYDISVRVRSELGALSREVHVPSGRIYANQSEIIASVVHKFGIASILAWAAVTLGLVFASRWSAPAFLLLTSPAIPTIGQWYLPLFEHLRFVRLWMLDRAYAQMRREQKPLRGFIEPVVQLATGEEKPALRTLLSQVRLRESTPTRIWITGQAGTGKSTLMEAFLATIGEPPTLAESWHYNHCVPLLLRVRDFGDGPVIDAIAHYLEPYGVDNTKLVARLLRTGDFLLVFDGLNERNWEEEVHKFLARFPEVPVVITAQTDARFAQMERWHLPLFNPAFAQAVLSARLRDPKSASNVPTQLWPEIHSGYDVVLLAELLAARYPLPFTKLGLYESTLDRAETLWTGTGAFKDLRASLCRQAWDLWLAAGYDITPSFQLPESFVQHLCNTVHILVRNENRYHFRHELMRQYLAAVWAVTESTSTQDLVRRLESASVWELGRTQQRDVFEFITSFAENVSDLQELANCAARDFARRAVLIEAVQRIAQKREWTIALKL